MFYEMRCCEELKNREYWGSGMLKKLRQVILSRDDTWHRSECPDIINHSQPSKRANLNNSLSYITCAFKEFQTLGWIGRWNWNSKNAGEIWNSTKNKITNQIFQLFKVTNQMKGKVGQRSHHVVIELCIVKFLSEIILLISNRSHCVTLKSRAYIISDLITCLQNFQNAHWARTCQFTPNISESRNWVKKVNIGCRKMNLKWLRVSRDSTTKKKWPKG